MKPKRLPNLKSLLQKFHYPLKHSKNAFQKAIKESDAQGKIRKIVKREMERIR
jgi:hypothetical protein